MFTSKKKVDADITFASVFQFPFLPPMFFKAGRFSSNAVAASHMREKWADGEYFFGGKEPLFSW